MAVRDDRINSPSAQEAAEWVITTMRSWFWQKGNNRRSKQWSDKMIRFITVRWTEGDFDPFDMYMNTENQDPSIPNFPHWDQDTINLCELLCVAMKTFYENDEGGPLLGLLEGIAAAAKEWNIASGDEEFLNIIEMINWMEHFFAKNKDPNYINNIKKIKINIMIALSHCDPNLSHPLTLSAYLNIINDISPLFKEFKNTIIMSNLEENFSRIGIYISGIHGESYELKKIKKFFHDRKYYPITEEQPGLVEFVLQAYQMIQDTLIPPNPNEALLIMAGARK
ncbi:MAG: hypothetical protein HQL81_01660 [Magnetococcales bacterium]|nr:hypothetical protein [Magnetococcales bacterium]